MKAGSVPFRLPSWPAAEKVVVDWALASRDALQSIGAPSLIGLGIASAQLTLLFRGGHVGTAIGASLIWMAGAVLLSDLHETSLQRRSEASKLRPVQRAAIAVLTWCLLVLSFPARLYDPLLLLLPLAALPAVALLIGSPLRHRAMRDLLTIGMLLPLQSVLVARVPTVPIVTSTARLSCLVLNGIGRSCEARGDVIVMAEQVVRVAPPCAGVETLVLAFTSSLVFLVLFPIRRPALRVMALISASIAAAYLLNAVRVAILALSSKQCDKHWWSLWCGFDFWHDGNGSHLFSLLAVSAVCLLWWWDIDRHERELVGSVGR